MSSPLAGGFQSFKFFKKIYKDDVDIDNVVFRMHYRFTVFILMISFFMISSKQFFGSPIHCISTQSSLDKNQESINSYCWVNGTFTLYKSIEDNIIGRNVISHGVGMPKNNDKEIYHKYYQWVCVIFVIQASMFYLPYLLWRTWEGGVIKQLSSEIDTVLLSSEKWTDSKKHDLVQYFVSNNGYNFYAYRFMICEFLNLVNIISQIFLLNSFLGGSFKDYGPAVATFLYDPKNPNNIDPMAKIFPKLTKCTFYYFGSSGSIQNIDFLCVLPLNVVNEKIFVFQWFWFALLAVITTGAVLYKLILMCCPCLRAYYIFGLVRTLPKFRVLSTVRKFNIGDWFLLYQLGKNVNSNAFKDLILELDREYEKKIMFI